MNLNTREYWDGEWARGVKKFPKYTMDYIRSIIPNESSVLDIGSGRGKFLHQLITYNRCTVYGIDISGTAIEQGKSIGVPGEVGDAENMDNFSQLFDVVVSAHTFEHIVNDAGLAKNVGRLAKKMAIIAVPNNCSGPEETGEHIRKYTAESLMDLMKPYFQDVTYKIIGKHLIVICKK